MADPFLSEIRMMSFGFAPQGWAQCNGQFLPINQNQALFSLLGTTYGGNGSTNFALPDLRGRVPTHTGGIGHFLGERGGEPTHTLSISQIPQHTHVVNATSVTSNTNIPNNNVLAAGNNRYTAATSLTSLQPSTVAPTGGSQAHENMQPYLTISFCIALLGIFPSPN
jgi:microcystin-dependent protein